MDIMNIAITAGLLGISGVLLGLLLGVASKLLAVETDEREDVVRELLPGINCGACGYASCDALAAAIVKGGAATNACPVGRAKTAQAIAEVVSEATGK